jgi:hypothetical protein
MSSDQNNAGVKTSAKGFDFGKFAIILAMSVAACIFYVLNFGFYPKNFVMEWDEEVKLHDGRIIVIHRKHNLERRGLKLTKYPDNYAEFRFISESFRFESSPGKVFEHTFVEGGLNFLDEVDGQWYIGYLGNRAHPSNQIGNTKIEPMVAVLASTGELKKVEGWHAVPAVLRTRNILRNFPPSYIAPFSGSILRQKEKLELELAHRASGDWDQIIRRP